MEPYTGPIHESTAFFRDLTPAKKISINVTIFISALQTTEHCKLRIVSLFILSCQIDTDKLYNFSPLSDAGYYLKTSTNHP